MLLKTNRFRHTISNAKCVTPSDGVLSMNDSLGGRPSILQQRIAKSAMQWFRGMIGYNGSPAVARFC